MDQSEVENGVPREFDNVKAEDRQAPGHIARNPYKQDNPSTLAITGGGTTKQKDTKEMNPTQTLMS